MTSLTRHHSLILSSSVQLLSLISSCLYCRVLLSYKAASAATGPETHLSHTCAAETHKSDSKAQGPRALHSQAYIIKRLIPDVICHATAICGGTHRSRPGRVKLSHMDPLSWSREPISRSHHASISRSSEGAARRYIYSHYYLGAATAVCSGDTVGTRMDSGLGA
jgi:hypothetical protein